MYGTRVLIPLKRAEPIAPVPLMRWDLLIREVARPMCVGAQILGSAAMVTPRETAPLAWVWNKVARVAVPKRSLRGALPQVDILLHDWIQASTLSLGSGDQRNPGMSEKAQLIKL